MLLEQKQMAVVRGPGTILKNTVCVHMFSIVM